MRGIGTALIAIGIAMVGLDCDSEPEHFVRFQDLKRRPDSYEVAVTTSIESFKHAPDISPLEDYTPRRIMAPRLVRIYL